MDASVRLLLLLLLLHGLGSPGKRALFPSRRAACSILFCANVVRNDRKCANATAGWELGAEAEGEPVTERQTMPEYKGAHLRVYPGAGRERFEARHGEALAVEFEILFFDSLLHSAVLLLLVDGHVVHRASQVSALVYMFLVYTFLICIALYTHT
jgi:hypothetical protein